MAVEQEWDTRLDAEIDRLLLNAYPDEQALRHDEKAKADFGLKAIREVVSDAERFQAAKQMPRVTRGKPPTRYRNEDAAIERIKSRVRARARSEELVSEILAAGERWRRLAAVAEPLPEQTRSDHIAGGSDVSLTCSKQRTPHRSR
jgi:hypothetical protein